MPDLSRPRLVMSGISKNFGATAAVQDVHLSVAPGEVHALIGENGAGKSTLMKILSGALQPDVGEIHLDGEPFSPENPHHARDCGISMIYQELNLALHLSVEENILLGLEPHCAGWIRFAKRRELARNALAALRHESLDLKRPVSSCTIAEQQVVEIARALVRQSKVVIMDEPTSSLTHVDTQNLFTIIRRLQSQGVSVLYISHFLEECRQICGRYSILRDGRIVASGPMADASLAQLIQSMTGRDVQEIYPQRSHTLGEPFFETKNISGRNKPRGLSLTLREGEIFGLAGLIGSGRTETVRTCFGLDTLHNGEVLIAGNPLDHPQPCRAWNAGLGFLSENRKEEGLMLNRSIGDNLLLSRLQPCARSGWISESAFEKSSNTWIDQLRVRCHHPRQPISELSGGNQQKVALARLLHHEARILLLDEPTRGIDVGSKSEIYQLLLDLAAQGKSILFVSSYLPELLGICDTIGVMHRGQLVESRPARDWTEQSLLARAIGGSQ